ncbi:hypothetical protein [Sphingomonas sp. Leaf10]|uniref:hypothetical protein n=1 Tax=Sphingomonas sp. Leaf10 TaxID=1735676 RepID=UPI0006FA6C5A|nr:hypothetical protein [Sphingomonas sp. Leaf10]KQM41232.1 hypothetical protein ASE59_02825 [Sphingomonas sp. Leaf10]
MKVGTLSDLAQIEGMPSVPSLARLIAARDDFPIIQRGRYGKPFVLDLDAAATFVREHWRDGRNERRRLRLAAEQAAADTAPSQTTLPGLFDAMTPGAPER